MAQITNQNAELSLLGSFLLKQDRLDIFHKLKENYFATEPAKTIYIALKKCIENDLEVNPLNVEVDKNDYLDAVTKSSMASPESSFYLVLDSYMARQAQELGIALATDINDNEEAKAIISTMESLLQEYQKNLEVKDNVFHISDILPKLFEKVQDEGYVYNFNIAGLSDYSVKAGHLVSIVARTKSGKTSFLTQVGIDCLNKNKSVLFCSLEVNEIEIGTKLLACEANVNPLAVTHFGEDGQSETNFKAITTATQRMENKKLQIYKTSECYISELKHKIIEFAKNNENPVVIIDQLQFIRAGKQFKSKIEEYDYIMQEIKSTASKTNCIIMLAHQLNRDIERRDGKFPMTSDIKDCGRIEEISDLVLMFAKSQAEKDENRYCTIISRHMQSGKTILEWNTKKARFSYLGEPPLKI